MAGFARRHEMYNADTAKRIRRSLRNRFQMGGVIQSVIFGYIKPPGVKTDAELQKEIRYFDFLGRYEGGFWKGALIC
jgi:hypothetical protein